MTPITRFTIAFALALCAAGAASADTCGKDGAWSLGGPAFGADATALAYGHGGCGAVYGRCEFTGDDGVAYILSLGQEGPRILHKQRPLRAGETLPLGILASDPMDRALAKALDQGVAAGYGRTGAPRPVSVVLACGPDQAGAFFLQLLYDGSGRMTGVAEAWAGGRYVYVDDPTFHFSLERPKRR